REANPSQGQQSPALPAWWMSTPPGKIEVVAASRGRAACWVPTDTHHSCHFTVTSQAIAITGVVSGHENVREYLPEPAADTSDVTRTVLVGPAIVGRSFHSPVSGFAGSSPASHSASVIGRPSSPAIVTEDGGWV